VHRIVRLSTGALRIRVGNGEGRPVAGVALELADLAGTWHSQTAPTDEQGRTALDPAPVGTAVFAVVPARLADPEAKAEFLAANKADPNAWKEAMVPLGRAEVTAGETPTEVELVLPASAGY
jgi:hypothetical protein